MNDKVRVFLFSACVQLKSVWGCTQKRELTARNYMANALSCVLKGNALNPVEAGYLGIE